MFNTYIKQLQYNFARVCYIHLVVSIYSFLILSCWGMPFGLLSFFGNLFFNPILMLFLCICTLLFFTELLYIPNGYLVYVVELLCSWWLYVLELGSTNRWNITCAQPSYLIIMTLICATFIIVIRKTSYLRKNIYLLLISCSALWFISQTPKSIGIKELPCSQGTIYLCTTDQEHVLIDPGYVGRYSSAASYVEYTLIPFLAQQQGSSTIHHLILLQPGQLLFEAITRLLEKITVKHIYIPVWKSETSKKTSLSYMRMKKLASQKNCNIHYLNHAELIIIKQEKYNISIRSLKQQLTSTHVTYTAYGIFGSIDKEPFTIYPAKYTGQTLT